MKRTRDARKLALMRSANTTALAPYGLGGRPKKRKPKPITLPKLKCQQEREGA